MRTAFEVLKEAGYPPSIVVLDLECFFSKEYTLSKMGICEFIYDSRFEAQGVGFCAAPRTEEFIEGDAAYKIKWLKAHQDNITISMHNAQFDATWLAMRCNWHPKYFIDTKLLACHIWPSASHSLKDLAAQLGLPAKGNTLDFVGKRYATMTPAEQQAYEDYTKNDVALQYAVGLKLLPMIDNPAIEIPLMQRTVELLTKPTLCFDFKKAKEITAGMQADSENAVKKTGQAERTISGNILFEKEMVQALQSAGDDPKQYFKSVKKGEALAMAKDDAERYQLLQHKNDYVRLLMEARVAIKSWPLHLRRIEKITSLAKCWDGLLPIPLNYGGTTTGRWSGGMKVNLQNMPKRGHPLLIKMRELLIAQKGYKIVSVDLSTIEARVLAWFAGQQDLLAAYEKGIDVYSEFGTEFFGCPVYKPAADDPAPVAVLLKKRRDFSKIVVLGCGFNMGVERFADYAECDIPTAEKAVYSYRAKYPHIVQMWKDIQEAFYYAPSKGNKLEILARGSERKIKLPSGRHLLYPELLGTVKDMAVRWDGKQISRVYGGFITENVVQGTARDLLAEAWLRIEARGYRVAHAIHDELLLHVPADKAEDALKVAIEEMTRRPTWGLDLPIGAEGRISDSYGAA
jgi:DNA polymerase bacteriophage-type